MNAKRRKSSDGSGWRFWEGVGASGGGDANVMLVCCVCVCVHAPHRKCEISLNSRHFSSISFQNVETSYICRTYICDYLAVFCRFHFRFLSFGALSLVSLHIFFFYFAILFVTPTVTVLHTVARESLHCLVVVNKGGVRGGGGNISRARTHSSQILWNRNVKK